MVPDDTSPAIGLRDYSQMLWRRKAFVLIATLSVGVVALFFVSSKTTKYQSSASVLVEPSAAEAIINPTAQALSAGEIATDLQLFSAATITDAVARTLGYVPSVTPTQVGLTNIIQVSATAGQPETAADIANAYANAFVSFQQTQSAGELKTAIQRVQAEVISVQAQIGLAPTAAQRSALSLQQTTLNGQLNELQVAAAVDTGGVTLDKTAVANYTPVSPHAFRDVALGLFGGFLIGCCGAFLREYLDDTVGGVEDLARASGGLVSLGVVPAANEWKDPQSALIVSVAYPHSLSAEAYRSLRTSIQFLNADRQHSVLQVTSPKAGEGKTTTVCNLAVSLANAGKRVCVVDCDLRRPRVHEFFGVTNVRGLTSIALGDCSLSEALADASFDERIRVLPSGPVPPNPSELLAGRRVKAAVRELSSQADVILLDSAPVLSVTDAAVLSPLADGIIVVVTAGKTTKRNVSEAVDALRGVGGAIAGTVLNAAAGTPTADGYREPYGHSYGDLGHRHRVAAAAATTSAKARRRARLSGVSRGGLALAVMALVATTAAGAFSARQSGQAAQIDLGFQAANRSAAGPTAAGATTAMSPAQLQTVASSQAVLSSAVRGAGVSIDLATLGSQVELRAQPGSSVATAVVSDTDPQASAKLSNAVATAFVTALRTAGTGRQARVIRPALSAGFGSRTHLASRVGLGFLLGVALLLVVLYAFSRRRHTLKTPQEAERHLGLPVIGTLVLGQKGG